MPFLCSIVAYESELLTQMCHTKNASPEAVHFVDYQAIRLGFAKVRCFTAVSCVLLVLLVLVNMLIYNAINAFVVV